MINQQATARWKQQRQHEQNSLVNADLLLVLRQEAGGRGGKL